MRRSSATGAEERAERLLVADGLGERIEEVERLPERVNGEALVASVGANVVAL